MRWELPLIMSALLLAVTVSLSLAGYLELRREALRGAAERLDVLAEQYRQMVVSQARGIRARAQAAAATPALAVALRQPAGAYPGALPALLDSLRPWPASSVSRELWDTAGRRIAVAGSGAARVAAVDPALVLAAVPRRDSATLTPFYQLGDSLYYAVVTAVGAPRPLGYYVEWRRLTGSAAVAESRAQVLGQEAMVLIGAPGRLWAHEGNPAGEGPPPAAVVPDRLIEYTREPAGARLAMAAPVSGTPWTVMVEFPKRAVLAPARRLVARLGVIAGLLLALGLGLAVAYSRRLSRSRTGSRRRPRRSGAATTAAAWRRCASASSPTSPKTST